jgi:hypothetical protein
LIDSITLHAAGQTPSWANNTTIDLGPYTIPSVSRDSIASIAIVLGQTGNTCQIFTTTDNWDIGTIRATISDPGPSTTILNLVGAPDNNGNPLLARLGGGNGGPPGSVQFTTIYACP